MIQELIYTSAPQGLRAGSSGFCTVATTHGMSPTLIEQLESLSGYRHVFQPQDPQAKSNPINFSHLKITVGGVRYSVLSRIADAGIDYTQRTNKIAHHVVFDAQDSVAAGCGPAALLASPGFAVEHWNGELRHPLSGRKTMLPDPGPTKFDTWRRLTGHAGWGGILAETAVRGRNRDTCILFQSGMPLLKLVQEAMSLLTPGERWNTTFSTYYTKLPPGVECRWRFLLDGSAEARAAARMPNTLVLTLGGNAGPPPQNEFSQAAEAGTLPNRPREAAGAEPSSAGTVVSFAQTRQSITPVDDGFDIQAYAASPPSSGTLRAMSAAGTAPSSQRIMPSSASHVKKSPWMKPLAVGLGFVIVIGLIGTAFWLGARTNRKAEVAVNRSEARTDPSDSVPRPASVSAPTSGRIRWFRHERASGRIAG